MARYIDAEEALRMMKNSRQDCPYTATKKLIWNLAHDSCTSCIMATETADVVEVVRCKNCKHRSTDDFRSFYCRKDDVGCKDDDFCSGGERRDT